MPDQERGRPSTLRGVSIPERGWGGFTGHDTGLPLADVKRELPPDVPHNPVSAEPIAEIRIKLFGRAVGQAEIQVWAAPDGPLAAVRQSGLAQAAAIEQLQEIVNREFGRACHLFRS